MDLGPRVLDALLREDYAGLGSRVYRDKTGVFLDLPTGRKVRLTPGSIYQDFSVDGPLGLGEVLETLRRIAPEADATGVEAFARECREALATIELHEAHHATVLARLKDQPRTITYYDTLAAFVDHPVYPTGRCRLGLGAAELRAYAPEFAPRFQLRWARAGATAHPEAAHPNAAHPNAAQSWAARAGANHAQGERVGKLPSWWPAPDLFPVHPLSVNHLPAWVRLEPEPYLEVTPTLSMRTVAVTEFEHLKLPLATSTLGMRNRRSIRPGTLADGALAERILRPLAGPRVLLADEQTYGHAGHDYLGYLVRKYPEKGEIVAVAALLAPSPDGRPVIQDLAERHYGGDVLALLDEYLDVLFEWNVRLFAEHGIALEAHQQNLSLVLGDGPLKLLVKDNDGLLSLPGPAFEDRRMITEDPCALADVFVTITLHLAAAAIAFGTADLGLAAPQAVRNLLTSRLAQALDRHDARLLRARTLDAARLVGKSMVTAGTLVDKARTGAADINKYYGTTGPNYLREGRRP